MGFLKEAYTKEYFLNLYTDRTKHLGIRQDQLEMLYWLDLKDKTVLDIGCGCGEVMRLCLALGASQVTGIDFSPDAIALATQTLRGWNDYILHEADILEYMKQNTIKYDYVLMMDSIEHIPASEIDAILQCIKLMRAIIIVHTPFYPMYEDYILQDYKYKRPSPSDRNPKTKGMHCTKYTKQTLIKILKKHKLKHYLGQNLHKPVSKSEILRIQTCLVQNQTTSP